MTDQPQLLHSLEQTQPDTNPLGQGSLSVLLIENNPDDARMVEEMLREQASSPGAEWDFEIAHVTKLKDALKAVKRDAFDLVLLDIELPDSQGLDTVRQMRAASAQVAIIVLSGNDDQEVALRAVRAGAQDYIVKSQIDGDLLIRSARYSIERIFFKKSLEQEATANQEILDSLSAHIAVLDSKGQIVRTNQAWEEFSRANGGRPETTSFGVNYLEILAGAVKDEAPHAEEALRAIQRVLDGISHFESIEYPCHSPKAQRWFTMRVTPLDRDNRQGVVVAHEDISERRLTEYSLHERTKELQTLMDSAPDIVARYDMEGRHTFISPSIERYTGKKPEYYINKTDWELDVPHERASLWQTAIQQVKDTGKETELVYSTKYQPNTKQQPQTFQAKLVPEFDPSGLMNSVMVIARDISDLTDAQELVKAREAVLQAVSFASQEFIRQSPWREALDEVLVKLGTACDSHRAHLWQNHIDEKENLLVTQIFEWTARPDLRLQDEATLQGASYANLGFERWRNILSKGEPLFGPVSLMPESERAFLEPQPTKSILIVPVFVRQAFWGFLGFDDAEREREWDPTIVQALESAAGALGAAIARDEYINELSLSEQRFKCLVENSWHAVCVADENGEVSYASETTKNLLGFSAELFQGVTAFDLIHPDDLAEASQAFIGLISGELDGSGMKARVRNNEGDYRIMEIRGKDLRDDPSVQGIVINFRDVTEEVEAKRALEQNEKFMRSVLENISDIIGLLDRDGRVRYLSPSASRVLGDIADDLLGLNVYDLLGELEGSNVRASIEQAWSNPGQEQVVRFRWDSPTGGFMEFEAVGSVQEDDQGELGLLVSTRDISQQRELERKLQRERDLFEMLTTTSPTAIALLDVDGHIEYANPEAVRVLGVEKSEIETRTYNDPKWNIQGFDGEPFPYDQLPFEQAIQQRGPVFDIRFAINGEEGDRKLLSANAAPVLDSEGKVRSVVTNFVDITSQVHAAETITANERRFRSLVQNVADIITIVDETGEIIYESPALERVLGYQPDNVVGESVFEPVLPEDKEETYKLFKQLVNRETELMQTNLRIRGLDGEVRHLEVLGTNLLEDPAVGGVVFNSRDVTDRREAELQLRASEERYRSLYNSIRDAILLLDGDQRIVHGNPAFIEMFGYRMEEIQGEPTASIYQNSIEYELLLEEYQANRNGKEWLEAAISANYVRKDGEVFPGETSLYDLYDVDGEIVGTICLIRDVTQRLKKEREQQAILQVAKALRTAGNREEMPPIILEQLAILLNAGGTEMVLFDALQERLWVELGYGSWEHFTGLELDWNQDVLKNVLGEGNTVQIEDVRQLPGFVGAETLTKDVVAAVVPMMAGSDPIGLVWIARDQTFTDEELKLARAIGDMAGNALRRAGLHAETEMRASQMATASRISQELAEQLDEFAIYDRLIGATKELLPAVSSIMISRFDINNERLIDVFGEEDGEIIEIGGSETNRLDANSKQWVQEAIEQRQPVFLDSVRKQLSEADTKAESPEWMTSHNGICVPMIAEGEVIGVLKAKANSHYHFSNLDAEIMRLVANTAAVALENATLLRETQGAAIELAMAYDTTLEGWAHALELRDKETEGHTRRVAELTVRLASLLGVPADDLVHARRGALMHDIGKMGIPDSILLKPGKLSEAEWEIMRQHPQMAFDMLKSVDFLRPALQIPLYHHERWNGSGYPKGLKAQDIPLAARIFAVVDVYDALSSDRPYREAWPPDKVQEYLRQQAGSEFDPEVVETFFEMLGFPWLD